MKVRGRRECRDCGTRWSYYDTGSVACPDCGSVRSVGRDDERQLHTDGSPELDLSPARAALDESLDRAAELAAELAGTYTRRRGFVSGGELTGLDDRFLAAVELRHVAGAVRRTMRVDAAVEEHFLALLAADEGRRPPPEDVPAPLRSARGLAGADAVDAYLTDVRATLREHPDSEAASLVETLDQHVARARALDGAIDPAAVESLVTAARDLGRYLRGGEEAALATAHQRLEGIGP